MITNLVFWVSVLLDMRYCILELTSMQSTRYTFFRSEMIFLEWFTEIFSPIQLHFSFATKEPNQNNQKQLMTRKRSHLLQWSTSPLKAGLPGYSLVSLGMTENFLVIQLRCWVSWRLWLWVCALDGALCPCFLHGAEEQVAGFAAI